MEFQSGNATTLDMNEEGLSARRALDGAYITLRVEGRATQWGQAALIISGRLQFALNSSPALVWPVFELTNASAQSPLRMEDRQRLTFEGYLTYAQLEAFESARAGRPFQLTTFATLQVILGNNGGLSHWSTHGRALQLPEATWLNTLAQAGFKRYLVQVMSFPPDHTRSGEPAAYQYLQSARDYFDKDLYEPCIVELRKAIDLVTMRRNDKTVVDEADQVFSKGKRSEMSIEERFAVMRLTIYHAMHKAAHVNHGAKYARKDAKALLACTATLVELFPEPDITVST